MSMSSSIPLNSPVHGSVGNQERGCDVEHLVPKTTEGIEDGSMAGTGQRTLAVRRERVTGDTLGSRAACVPFVRISLFRVVVSRGFVVFVSCFVAVLGDSRG